MLLDGLIAPRNGGKSCPLNASAAILFWIPGKSKPWDYSVLKKETLQSCDRQSYSPGTRLGEKHQVNCPNGETQPKDIRAVH